MSGMDRELGWPIYEEIKARWMAGEIDATHPGGESYRVDSLNARYRSLSTPWSRPTVAKPW